MSERPGRLTDMTSDPDKTAVYAAEDQLATWLDQVTPERSTIMERQRQLVAELFAALMASEGRVLDAAFQEDYATALDDAARTRVVVDQIASLTDASAVEWHRRLARPVEA